MSAPTGLTYLDGHRNGRLDRLIGVCSDYVMFAVELGEYRSGYVDGVQGRGPKPPREGP